ncbi:MAG: acyltransferase [Muribaculaceae bacterium]|nr:acyltransferase [Muribaculaceae bacterium]
MDVLRVIATVLVLLVHAPIARYADYGDTPSRLYPFYIVVVTIGSKLFFMISGALLLPVRRSWREFLKRRLHVVLIPLIIWSFLYLLSRAYTGNLSPRQLISIFFYPIDSSLWFVYVMVVFYVFMPVLSRCVEAVGKRGVELYLALWILSSFIPYQHGVFMGWEQFSHNMFSSFSGYLGYVVMGYYLHRWPVRLSERRVKLGLALFVLVSVVVFPVFEFTIQNHFGLSYQQHLDTVTYDISINTIAMGVLLFIMAQHFAPASYAVAGKKGLSPVVGRVANCSYGIYLSNMLTLRFLVWPATRPWLETLPWIVDGLVCAVLVLVLTYALCRVIMLTPFSKYVIGR